MIKLFLQKPIWLFFLSVFILLVVFPLVQQGMFMDGQQYAVVAKNLADGKGTFWFPYLSPTWFKAESGFFLEHPPLVYFLESFFFRWMGDGWYVEKMYSLFTATITALLIAGIWKEEKGSGNDAWLPLLLWIMIPVCFWSYSNNVLENTMGIFTLLAFWMLWRFSKKGTILHLLLGSFFVVLGFLSKGIPALFPLAIPVVFSVVYKTPSVLRSIGVVFWVLIVVLIMIILICINHDARESLWFYIEKRLLYRVSNEPTTESRLNLLRVLFSELLPVIALVFVLIVFQGKSLVQEIRTNKSAKFFLLVGLCASLPLMLTGVQRNFYLLPSLPFYALAFGLWIEPIVVPLSEINVRSQRALFSIAFIVVLLFTVKNAGGYYRDEAMLKEVHQIGKCLSSDQIIACEESMLEDWSIQFYLLRYYGIALYGGREKMQYLLTRKKGPLPSLDWKSLDCALSEYNLYRRN